MAHTWAPCLVVVQHNQKPQILLPPNEASKIATQQKADTDSHGAKMVWP